MKYISIIAFLVSVTIGGIHAQTIQYLYDNAGNRTQRKVFVNLVPPDAETTASARNSPLDELEAKQAAIRKSIQVFPNPAQDQLQINIGAELPNATVELFDLSGKLILQQKLSSFNHSINIANQPSGEYLLIITDKGFNGQWKIIKTK